MDINKNANLSMLCDFYELTMGNGYFVQGMQDRITYFDIFFRSVPDNGGYAIAAGLEQAIEYIQQLHFDEDDIAYLRSRNMFDEGFLDYLRNFRFTGDIWAVPEGTPIFPREPIMTVRAPAIQAQLVETFLLLTLNHQSLIATKANRVVRAAKGRVVLEFGSRRAQGVDAAVDGARAAYIGGCKGTACTLTDQLYGVPAGGTMAHSWVQMFPSEYEAFKAYCETYPDNPTLLVDTYNTLRSGIPNAIRVFNEVLKPRGLTKCGIRLDSGDMTYLTRKARKMLDEAGWQTCQISCSNSLDEYIIEDILNQGAQIDMFGVGERLITAKSEAVFGGVYKLTAIEDERGTSSPRSRSAKTSARSRTRTSKRSTASLATTPARPSPTISACMTRRSTTAGIWRSLTRRRPGSARRSTTSRPRSCSCPFSRAASSSTSCRRSARSRPTAPSRSIPSGTRSSASTTRTRTMSTCRRSSGTSRTGCCTRAERSVKQKNSIRPAEPDGCASMEGTL